jgi:hypothetical protein
MRLTLYQRDDCKLCDEALDVLAQAGAPDFASVFIDGDEALEARFGARVPVLLEEHSQHELDWPFDVVRLRGFIDACEALDLPGT